MAVPDFLNHSNLDSVPDVFFFGFPVDKGALKRRGDLLTAAWFLYTGTYACIGQEPSEMAGFLEKDNFISSHRLAVVFPPGMVSVPNRASALVCLDQCVTAVYPVEDPFRVFSEGDPEVGSSLLPLWPFLLLVETPWFLGCITQATGSYRQAMGDYFRFFGSSGLGDSRFRSGASLFLAEDFSKALAWSFLLFKKMGVVKASEVVVWEALRTHLQSLLRES